MIAIKVEDLSKVYKLYDAKKDRLKEAVNPFKANYHREFYALKNISFKVQQGEIIGIVGKNGSGKSTLLKIITGLLTPTVGSVEVNGKVSALLELGAGFNPEYTGIENIYQNGTIMGFTREQMEEKIDCIVSFADIGEFIRQPVKMYSSGMYVRLAFAVAINVDPNILIIDEALAVGDIKFQQKCYRKIDEFREKGKTILFCTHDTGAVLNLCTSCLWIHEGSIKDNGHPDAVIKKYRAYMYYEQNVNLLNDNNDKINKTESDIVAWQSVDNCSYFGEGGAVISAVSFFEEETGKPVNILRGGEQVVVGIKAKALSSIERPIFGFNIKNAYGINAFGTNTFQEECKVKPFQKEQQSEIFFSFAFPPLSNGIYNLDIAIADGTQVVHIQHCWKFDVYSFQVENIGEKYSFGYIYLQPVDVIIK